MRTFFKGEHFDHVVTCVHTTGLSPALLLNVPQIGIFIYFYKLSTNLWKKSLVRTRLKILRSPAILLCITPNFVYTTITQGPSSQEGHVSGVGSMVCGFVSGMTSRVSVLPLDAVKKRIQVIKQPLLKNVCHVSLLYICMVPALEHVPLFRKLV